MPNILCTFENQCQWTMLKTPNGTWTSGEAQDNTEGPHYDHTEQNEKGHYAFLTQPDHRMSLIAGMIFTPDPSTEEVCVNFWYNMQGSNTKKLTLKSAVGIRPIGFCLFPRNML